MSHEFHNKYEFDNEKRIIFDRIHQSFYKYFTRTNTNKKHIKCKIKMAFRKIFIVTREGTNIKAQAKTKFNKMLANAELKRL